MFQNIAKDFEENQNVDEDVKLNRSAQIREVCKKCFSKKMMILYMVSFLLSFVSFNIDKELAPFGMAILIAMLSNCIPIGIASIVVLIGTGIQFGGSNVLTMLLTLLLLFVSILIRPPKYEEENNEKRKLGVRLFVSCFIVQIGKLFFGELLLYDVVYSIIYSIVVTTCYKIFVHSISVLTNLGKQRAYTIEEVMGASLLVAISVCAIGNITIFGYSIRTILCILIVLIMGWKNGILVGAPAGITIGSVVGMIGGAEPSMIAAYALSRYDGGHF